MKKSICAKLLTTHSFRCVLNKNKDLHVKRSEFLKNDKKYILFTASLAHSHVFRFGGVKYIFKGERFWFLWYVQNIFFWAQQNLRAQIIMGLCPEYSPRVYRPAASGITCCFYSFMIRIQKKYLSKEILRQQRHCDVYRECISSTEWVAWSAFIQTESLL